jgi:hypothetical protein
MINEIGTTAGMIWQILDKDREASYTELKKKVNAKGPLFDWAIGWLAREDRISISQVKQTLRIGLK